MKATLRHFRNKQLWQNNAFKSEYVMLKEKNKQKVRQKNRKKKRKEKACH